jgi:hypothetical protein
MPEIGRVRDPLGLEISNAEGADYAGTSGSVCRIGVRTIESKSNCTE